MKKFKMFIGVAALGLVFMFSSGAMADGTAVFASKCTMCHGAGGAGTAMGPKLAGNDFIKGDAAAIKAVITAGVSGGDKKYANFPMAMPKFALSDAELDQVVEYLKSL